MKASNVRRVEVWDGTKLNFEDAYQGSSIILWRCVEHSAVVREILETNDCCWLFMGNRTVVEISQKMSEKQLAPLLGARIKVCGSSFNHTGGKTTISPSVLYIGVLDPDLQIEVLKPSLPTLAEPETWLRRDKVTIDHVAQRYVAVDGHGITTAMSQHLRPGDVVDLKALQLRNGRLCTKQLWLKKTSRGKPSSPTVITGKRKAIHNYLHRRVKVRGTVEHCFATERGPELLLSDRHRTYLVSIPFPDERRQVDQYARGVVVSLTGVIRSISQIDESIRLDVANAEDLVIAETPMQFQSWLVKSTAAGILFISLLLGFWHWALKRQVHRKTEELNTSISRMVAASSAVRDGLLIFDAESRVRFVSDKVRTTMGITIPSGDTQIRTRRRLESLVSEKDTFNKSWSNVFRTPLNTFEGEFSLHKLDRQVLAFSAPVYDAAGRPDGRIWTFEDITERRKLEDETLQTRKLGAIGRLAGGVAHDFNNLLQVIGSNLELMQHSTDEHALKAEETSVEPALAAVKRGAELTRQLLTFARTSRVEITPTNVNQLLDRTARMLDRTLGDHIRLSISLTPDMPLAEIDSGQLEQVVINMCLNSGEAIGLNDGFIKISTKTAEHKQIGTSIVITIEDDGCGMSPQVLSHVFEPFFTTKDIDKGTGLGLATAFGAVEQMQGRIECSSNVSEGTCFQIFLPVAGDARLLPQPIPAAKADISAPRRILLVDDDARVLNTVRQLLVRLGHDVICAGGGAEAMAKLQSEPVDLVMLDLSMPEMTGWQVLKNIREQHSDLKIIVCSGYSHDAAEMVASEVPADAFLDKPFQLEQLSVALESLS